jgi:hypothetical protein
MGLRYALALLVLSSGADAAAVEWPFDMRVERVDKVAEGLRVTTTGAGLGLRPSEDRILLVQRIGGRRVLGTVEPGRGVMEGLRVTAQDDQQVVLESDSGVRFEVTCDSVLRVTCPPGLVTGMTVGARTSHEPDFRPEYVRSTREGTLILDERGGLGVYPLFPAETRPAVSGGPEGCELQVRVPPGEDLVICVCPPRPYNWRQHHEERIVHQFPELTHGVPGDSPRPLPTDEELVAWRKMGNILVLHLEFWDGFGIQHIKPRDPARFRQVVRLAHELGYLVLPYSSPYYYTPAVAPGGKLRDNAVDLYMAQAKWLLEEYGVDGLYWDGVFPDVENAWECARRMRQLLGRGRLYVHCTTLPLRDPDLPVPFVDTWADYLLRGEGLGREHIDPIYLRYVASGYNISNAIGELCYETCRVDRTMFDWALEANVRIPYWPGRQLYGTKAYFLSPEEDALFKGYYVPAADGVTGPTAYAKLTPAGAVQRQARRAEQDRALAAGEAEFRRYLAERKAKLQDASADNLAAFKGGECSDYSRSVWSPHGIGHRLEYATDQNPETYWAADHPPVWLTIDLGKVETISKVRVTNYFADKRYYHYRVDLSEDNSGWTKVGEKTNDALATAAGDLYEFPPTAARYVRVTMLYNSANWGQHVSEVWVSR